MTRHPHLLDRNNSALVIVDIQEKLSTIMKDRDVLLENVSKLIKGCRILNVPVFYTEQYPKGLGRTEKVLVDLLADLKPVEKIRFSVCNEIALMRPIKEKSVQQIILAGIETHVCILQSALDFLHQGYQVHIPADAAFSRKEADRQTALNRLAREGVIITSTEAALFELMAVAGSEEFKQISKLVK